MRKWWQGLWRGGKAAATVAARAPRRKLARVVPPKRSHTSFTSRRKLVDLTPEKMLSIFQSADQYLADQIILAAEMEESDTDLAGTLRVRRAGVRRLLKNVQPGDPNDDASAAAAEKLTTLTEQGWWGQMEDWLLRAIWHQYATVELQYDGDWMPRGFRTIEPERYYVDEDLRVALYRDLSQQSTSDLVQLTPGAFVHHTHLAVAGQPGRYANVRTLAKMWYLAHLNLTGWGKLIDRWGQPFTHFEYDPSAMSEVELAGVIDTYLALADEMCVATPQGVSVNLQKPIDQLANKEFADAYARCVSRFLLGQETAQHATAGQETGATVQGQVRDDLRDEDAEALDDTLATQLIKPWCAWVYGPAVQPPTLRHVAQTVLDQEQRGRVFLTAQQLGLPITKEQVYDELGITTPGEDDELLVAPVQAQPQYGGFGWGGPTEPQNSVESTESTGAPERETPEAPAAQAAEAAKDATLTGIQITTLQELLQSVSDGTQSAEVVTQIIEEAYPGIAPEKIRRMVAEALRFAQTQPVDAEPVAARRVAGRAAIAARGADPARAVRAAFAERLKAVRRHVESAGSLTGVRDKLANLFAELDRVDGDPLTAALHEATWGAQAAGRLATARKITTEHTESTEAQSFGRWFKGLRLSKGFKSARALGIEAGLSYSHVAMIERDETIPKAATLDKIGAALELDTEEVQGLYRKAAECKFKGAFSVLSVPSVVHVCGGTAEDDDLIRRGRFSDAIDMMAQRTDLLPKAEFLKLEGMNRSRAWTVARVADLDILKDLHGAVGQAVEGGQSHREFLDSLDDVMAKRGWGGLEPWHAKIVYDQNVGMAYTTGRTSQARDAGVSKWRKLPSTSRNPRSEHARYDGQVFTFDEMEPPPWDFGCNCGWEVVFDDEVEPDQVDRRKPNLSGQEFQFDASHYYRPRELRQGDYPRELWPLIRSLASDKNALLEVRN